MAERAPIYVFAGGGTGGHLYPAIAVAEQLLAIRPDAQVLFACTERAIDARVLDAGGWGYVRQPIVPIPHRPLAWPGFLRRWRLSLSLARWLLEDLQPACVLGLGGFAAAPLVRQAARRGLPTGLLNPDAVPGKANAYLMARAGVVFTQFDSTAEHIPAKHRGRVRAVGCPIRAGLVGVAREEGLQRMGLDAGRRTLAVMGGSLGAQSINEAVLGCLPALSARRDRWQVLHVTGPGKAPAIEADYAAAEVPARVLEYCHDMAGFYAAADLAIGRAGANSVAELAATGTPSLLLPYPHHRDNHQALNAAALADAGGALVVPDAAAAAENARRLTAALEPLLDDPDRLAAMANAARRQGQPDAARSVAQWLAGL